MASAAARLKTRAPRALLHWVALGLAAAALASAVFLTIQYSSGRDLFVYRVTLLLLFFAISTVSALIFNVKANLSGNFWGLTLGVGGPAALWIIALLIFTKAYPEAALVKEASLQRLAKDFWGELQKTGWQDYESWKTDNGDDFGDILGANETETLRNLFWNVHYRSPGQRLDNVQITTVFLYFGPKYTMKFQRIRGSRESAQAEPFVLHYGGQTSNSTGTSGSVLLVGRHNNTLHLKDSYYDGDEKPEQTLAQADIDCLIVTWYNDEVTGDGDYITADMKEYSTTHRAGFRLGIAAFKPMEEPRSWWLSARTVTDSDNLLPLRFRPMRQIWRGDLAAIEGDLKPWLDLLDNAMASDTVIKAKPRDMLKQAIEKAGQAVGHPVKVRALLTHPAFKNHYSASMPEAEDVVLTMFLWHVN